MDGGSGGVGAGMSVPVFGRVYYRLNSRPSDPSLDVDDNFVLGGFGHGSSGL